MRMYFLAALVAFTMPLLAIGEDAAAQPGPNGRPGQGPRGPGAAHQGPGMGAVPGDVRWTDVQVHLRAGSGRNFEAVIDAALAETAPLGRQMLVLVPPPFPSEAANANVHDYDVFLGSVRRHPDALAFLGGSKLNAMLQATEANAVTADVQRRFLAQATRVLDDGARGFGELALLHFSQFDGHPYERAAPDHPLMLALADLAAARNAPIAVHMEAVPADMDLPPGLAAPPNPRRVAENIAAFERLLSHNASARIVWLHNGWDNTGQRTPQLVQRLMAAHPNLMLSLKFHRARSGVNQVVSPAGPNAEWMAVIRAWPDRIVIGSDSFFAGGNSRAGTVFEPQPIVGFLGRLPPPLAQRIGFRNAERIYNLPVGRF